jgi:hypothetical protein
MLARLLTLATFLLLPATVVAGGPPRLCLPIDGVTAETAQACAGKLTAALDKKLWQHGGADRAVQIREHKNQWYLTFPMGAEVALADVEAALKGSRLSIPRDRLRLFGHVILEIDAGKSPAAKLLADLDAIEQVSIAESQTTADRLVVTLDMPYPVEDDRSDRSSIGWETFARNDLSSDTANRSSVKAAALPSLAAVGEILAKHGARLQEIRWSQEFACRALGCVVDSDTRALTSARRNVSDKD